MTTLFKDQISYETYGETIAVGDMLYKSTGTGNDSGRTAGRLYKLDVTNVDRNSFYGIAKESGSAGNTNKKVVTAGRFDGLSGLTAGLPVYASISTPGAYTQVKPAAKIQVIGMAVDADSINVNAALAGSFGAGEGSGAGGINYILNPDAEAGTTGYVRYANASAAASPESGTGGSPNVNFTFTDSSSSPLRGTKSFLITKDAVNRQGHGVSYDFTIDAADKAQVLRISFDYDTSISGTYADGDIRVYVYDVTNSQLIEVVDRDLYASAFGKYTGTFQTSSNSTSYRLIFHVASTSALAYSIKLDNVVVGPQNLIKGAIVTDWESYVPTFTGLGTVTNASGRFKRIGDHLEVSVSCTTGTATASLASISLPSELLIDSSKLSISNTTANPGSLIGNYNTSQPTAGMIGNVVTAPSTSTALVYIGDRDGNAGSHLTPVNGSTAVSSSSTFSATFKVPILGWSSNVTLSEDAGNREIYARLNLNNVNQTVSSSGVTTVQFSTAAEDTASGFDLANNQWVCQESGLYDLVGSVYAVSLTSADNNDARILINGALVVQAFGQPGNSTAANTIQVSVTYRLKKGDTVRLAYNSVTDASYTINGGIARTYLTVAKRSSPQTIAASEIVACRYSSNSGQAVNTNTVVIYEDISSDTHNAYNTSTGVYTVPQSGWYSAFASMYLASYTPSSDTNALDLRIRVNSVAVSNGIVRTGMTATSNYYVSTTLGCIYLTKGAQIDVLANTSVATNLSTSNVVNLFTIHKINGVS